ncbi:hypothetical protein GH733_000097 [Mirounga leonina]|nr:hypothetical protein GH733_000097 [Mirounga leonina]
MGTREEARGLAAAQRLPNQMLNVNTEEILPQEMDAFSGRTHSTQPAPCGSRPSVLSRKPPWSGSQPGDVVILTADISHL